MTDPIFQPRPAILRRVWKAVFEHQHKPTKRELGLSMASHNTLLRAPGPLGVWEDGFLTNMPLQQYANTRKLPENPENIPVVYQIIGKRRARQEARQSQMQDAILISALQLGIVSAKDVAGFL